MPLLFERKSVLTAKIESTYGTDSVPVAATNAVKIENLTVDPLNQETVQEGTIQPHFGGKRKIGVRESVDISFDVQIAGSGTAGTAPAYAELFRMCANAETIVAATSAGYNPISSAIESGTIYFYADGVLHKAVGCRGNVSLKISAGGIPVYSFTFKGLYAPVTDVTLPTPTLTAYKTPLVANSTNTTFSIHGYAAVLSEFTLDYGNQVVHGDDIGDEQIMIIDRNVTAKAVIRAPDIATKDFYAIVRAETLGVVTVTQGTVAGNIIESKGDTVQLSNPTYSEKNGIRMLNLDLDYIPTDVGNDEHTITNT